VIDDKTPFLGKEIGFFILEINKLDKWQKTRPDIELPAHSITIRQTPMMVCRVYPSRACGTFPRPADLISEESSIRTPKIISDTCRLCCLIRCLILHT
jgi:hypothetical protein